MQTPPRMHRRLWTALELCHGLQAFCGVRLGSAAGGEKVVGPEAMPGLHLQLWLLHSALQQ